LADDVRGSAEVIVPIVVDLLRPNSVLDVGCGRGTWLDVFRSAGVTTIVGVDGPHVVPADLEIPADAFVQHDLSVPVQLGRTFDLVVSLEVAEHLDADLAPAFVSSLAAHGPAVLFSAAIPFQGGAGHVNERWPSYWAKLFATHGYIPVDVVRPAVWRNDHVAFWYAQNTLLYVDDETATNIARGSDTHPGSALDLVHPALFEREHRARRAQPAPGLRRALRELPRAASRAVKGRARGEGS
jgi:SAM-dependent methyltransferase